VVRYLNAIALLGSHPSFFTYAFCHFSFILFIFWVTMVDRVNIVFVLFANNNVEKLQL